MKRLIFTLLMIIPFAASAQEEVVDDSMVVSPSEWKTSYQAGTFLTMDGISAAVGICEQSSNYQVCVTGVGFGPTLDSTFDVAFVLPLAEDIDLSFGAGLSTLTVLVAVVDLLLLMGESDTLIPLPPTQVLLQSQLTLHLPINHRLGLAVTSGMSYHAATNDDGRFPRGIAVTMKGAVTRKHWVD